MKKLFTLLTMLIVGIGSSWGDGLMVSTTESASAEYQYKIFCRNASTYYLGNTTNATNSGTDYGLFAFFADNSGDYTNGYYIYSIFEGKWVSYDAAASYSKGKNKISLVAEKPSVPWNIAADNSDNKYYDIRPFKTDKTIANMSWNWYDGASYNTSNTMGFDDFNDDASGWGIVLAGGSGSTVADRKVVALYNVPNDNNQYALYNSSGTPKVYSATTGVTPQYFVLRQNGLDTNGEALYRLQKAEMDGKYLHYQDFNTDGYNYMFLNTSSYYHSKFTITSLNEPKWAVSPYYNLYRVWPNAADNSSRPYSNQVSKCNDAVVDMYSGATGNIPAQLTDKGGWNGRWQIVEQSYTAWQVIITGAAGGSITYKGSSLLTGATTTQSNNGIFVISSASTPTSSDFTINNVDGYLTDPTISFDSDRKLIKVAYTEYTSIRSTIVNFLANTPETIGYPTTVARTTLQTAIGTFDKSSKVTSDLVTLNTAYATFQNTTDINIPEAGKVYTIQTYVETTPTATSAYFENDGGTFKLSSTISAKPIQDLWIAGTSGDYIVFQSAYDNTKYYTYQAKGIADSGTPWDLSADRRKGTKWPYISLWNKDMAGTNDGRYLGSDGSSHLGKFGSGTYWGKDKTQGSSWSTDFKFTEIGAADNLYTVVSNINAGGVTYTPSYTGTAEQTNGGYYILASAPSASDFTAIAVANCTPGEITVNTTTRTITVNYTLNPVQVTDVASISSTKVYRLRTGRTAIYAESASATRASATATADASTLDVEEPLNQWAFVEKDSKKYLYNVGAKKFLKTSPYVDYNMGGDYAYSAWGHNFLESYTTHEVQLSANSYTDNRFWLKDVKGERTRIYNTCSGGISINGYTVADDGNAWIIEEIPAIAFNPAEAVSALNNSISYTFRKVNGDTDVNLTASDEERDVATGSTLGIAYNEGYYTPILQLKDIKVNGTSSSVGTKTISNGDVIEWIYKCPFSVSDEPSGGEFAANTYWHFLDIHSTSHYYLNIPESFDYSNKIPANTQTKSINDGFLWCITGNNTDGYRLYNKRAGATKVMTFTSGTGAYMSDLSGNESASLFKMATTQATGSSNTTGAPTFVFSGASARPNLQSNKVASWANSDKGSEFTFEPVEDAIVESLTNDYLAYFDNSNTCGAVYGLAWDDATSISALSQECANVYNTPTVEGYYTFVSHINDAKVQPVENAKYHIISAYPGYMKKQEVRKALYYDTSASIFKWKNYDSSDEVFTFQLRKTGDKWNIYNPSASKYLKDCQGSNNASDDPGTFTFTDLGLAQLNISDGTGTMHTAGHSDGAGTSGTITRWGGGRNGASAWYIAPILETVTAITPAAVEAETDVYQTFANPYDCQIAAATVHYVAAVDSKARIKQAENNYVPAGTGVVLKAKKGAIISIRPLSRDYDENLTDGTNKLVAGDGSTNVAAGNYMLAYGNSDEIAKFYRIGSAGYVVPANKAYLPKDVISVATGARSSLDLIFDDDEATGIYSIENKQNATDNVIYNVTGQKVDKMQKGIYIVNGKKIFVK